MMTVIEDMKKSDLTEDGFCRWRKHITWPEPTVMMMTIIIEMH